MTDLLVYFIVAVVIPGMLVVGIALRDLFLHHHHIDHHGPHAA
jgi:hypothetical protein